MTEKKIVYFEKPGKGNTDDVIKAVKERLEEGDIKHVVVASGTGETAIKLDDNIGRVKIIDVTYNAGMKAEKKEMLDKNKEELDKRDILLVSSTHTLSGVERSIAERWKGVQPALLIADTYRTFGEGMKVCVEASMMATDNGAVPIGEKIIVVAGTSTGADTAVVLNATLSNKMFQELGINEILCMPKAEGIKHEPR